LVLALLKALAASMCKDVTNKHCEDGRNRRDERSNQGRHGGQLQ
jgi:hypothetical protein